VGEGTLTVEGGSVTEVQIPDGVRRKLAVGDTLLLGQVRLRVRAAVSKGDKTIPVASDALNHLPTAALPIFWVEYDYVGLAQTTKVPADLRNGSLFITASVAENATSPVQSDQNPPRGTTFVVRSDAGVYAGL
jgi:hypothetical protein